MATALFLTASPAAASDFSALRVAVFASYYLFVLILGLAIYFSLGATFKGAKRDVIVAAVTAIAFAPSFVTPPNHFIAVPLVMIIGGSVDRPALTAISVLLSTVVLLLLFGLSRRRSSTA